MIAASAFVSAVNDACNSLLAPNVLKIFKDGLQKYSGAHMYVLKVVFFLGVIISLVYIHC